MLSILRERQCRSRNRAHRKNHYRAQPLDNEVIGVARITWQAQADRTQSKRSKSLSVRFCAQAVEPSTSRRRTTTGLVS